MLQTRLRNSGYMQHDTILTTVQHQNHTEINLLHIGASMKQKNLQGISIKNVMYANEQHILCIIIY